MRLTISMKREFVRDVMADVPKIDYREQVTKIVQQCAVNLMPDEIKKIHDDEELRHYLETNFVYIDYFGNFAVYGCKDSRERIKKRYMNQKEMN